MKQKIDKIIASILLYFDNMFGTYWITIYFNDDYEYGGINRFLYFVFFKKLHFLNIQLVKPTCFIDIDYGNTYYDFIYYNRIQIGFIRVGFGTFGYNTPKSIEFRF